MTHLLHPKTLLRFSLAACLVLLPGWALASKDFLRMSPGEEIIFCLVLLLFPALVLSNFILSLVNLSKRKKGIRIFNCIATGLLGLLLLPLFGSFSFSAISLLLLGGFLFQVALIYFSLPKQQKNYE